MKCARLFVVFLTLFASSSWAESPNECRPLNLTLPGQAFHRIPTYDQGGGNICFAYTAAQLIEGQRVLSGHRFRTNEAVSPISIALAHALANGESNLQQGGITCDAIEVAKMTSVCPKSKSFQDITEVELLLSEFQECRGGKAKVCQKIRTRLGSAAVQVLAQSNGLIYLKAVEDIRCSAKDRISLRLPKCERINEETFPPEVFHNQVDLVFDSANPRPVQIGYSMHLLSSTGNPAKRYIISRSPEPDDLMFSFRYKPHASILLGRRWKNGRCQYLLRNSQGASFCPMGIVKANDWECDSKSEGIWINAQELFESTFEVSNFQ